MSQRQTIIALSTMEAEISAMKEGTSEAVYLQYLLFEFTSTTSQMPPSIKVYCDNNSACVTFNTQSKFGRTKHYLNRINFIRSHVFTAMIKVQHFESGRMLADALTKPLTEKKFKSLFVTSGMSFG